MSTDTDQTSPRTTREIPMRVEPKAFVGGSWTDEGATGTFAVTDPHDGATIVELPDLGVDAVDAAMQAAQRGFEAWSAEVPRDRAEVLRRAYELVNEREDELARLITLEMGKVYDDALAEVRYANGFLLEYAERAPRIEGRHGYHAQNLGRIVTQYDPVGVCVFVTPWNFPLAMATRKIAPALAAGCSVIVKPAKLTPLTMLAFTGILLEAGVTTEAVSIFTTSDSKGTVAAMIEHEHAKKLSFTGSTPVGRNLAAAGGKALLRMSMELGGNAPFVVFDDADVDAAIEGAKVAKFRNGGQACTAANRFIVHEDVAEAFTAGIVEHAKGLTMGHGLDEGTKLGPLVDDDTAGKVAELVDGAIEAGATLACGGGEEAHGRYYPATVLTGVPDGAEILREEIFGPVVTITTFRDEDEAIRMANDTEYGLVAYAYTENAARLLRVSRRIEAGMVGMNVGLVSNPAAPFGGVKDSGFGREGGAEGLEEYLAARYVAIPDPH